jgi:hypothetical protein
MRVDKLRKEKSLEWRVQIQESEDRTSLAIMVDGKINFVGIRDLYGAFSLPLNVVVSKGEDEEECRWSKGARKS